MVAVAWAFSIELAKASRVPPLQGYWISLIGTRGGGKARGARLASAPG